jgi:hypothetical protein
VAKKSNRQSTYRIFIDASAGDDTAKLKEGIIIRYLTLHGKLLDSSHQVHYVDSWPIVADLEKRVAEVYRRNSEAQLITTPSSATLSALLPYSISEDVIANLNEMFRETWVLRHGARTARRIWRTQAALIIAQYWLSPLFSLLDRIKHLKIGG